MKIQYRENTSKWIDLEGGQRVCADYLSISQEVELNEIILDMRKFQPEKDSEDATDLKVKRASLAQQYPRQYLRYVIKDWRGIKNADGDDVQCELKDGRLTDNLYENVICRLSGDDLFELYGIIKDALRWESADSKK